MKPLLFILISSSIASDSCGQILDSYWATSFKAISIDKEELKFKKGVKQLGLFYLNPNIESLETISKDTILLNGKLMNRDINLSNIRVYLMEKETKRSFPFFHKVEIFHKLDKVAHTDKDGNFEVKLNFNNQSLLFIGGNPILDHIGLIVSKQQNGED